MTEQQGDAELFARKLVDSDIYELRSCVRRGYVTPRFSRTTGKMSYDQWRSWKRLQRIGCGEICGPGEAETFEINDFGREVLKKCKAKK